MKMTLSAPAVAKLVELDPEATIEIAINAAKQVATEMARRISQEAVEIYAKRVLATELAEGGWYQQQLAEKYRQMIFVTMDCMARKFIDEVTDGSIKSLILKRVNEVLAAHAHVIEKQMAERADQILRERFALMFKSAA